LCERGVNEIVYYFSYGMMNILEKYYFIVKNIVTNHEFDAETFNIKVVNNQYIHIFSELS
jgi:hypothetical protein